MTPRVVPPDSSAAASGSSGRQGRDANAVHPTKKKSALKRMLSPYRKKKNGLKASNKQQQQEEESVSFEQEEELRPAASLTDSAKAQRTLSLEFFGVDDEEARRILGVTEEDEPPPSRPSPEQPPDGDSDGPAYTARQLSEAADLVKRHVEIRGRTYKFKTYGDCFVGSEAVDCFVQEGVAASREEAVRLGRAVATDLGAFVHVCGEHDFRDEYLFYHVVTPAAVYCRRSSGELAVGGGPGGSGTVSNSGRSSVVRTDKYGFLLDGDPAAAEGSSAAGSVASSSPGDVHRSGDAKRWTDILDRAPRPGGSGTGAAAYAATQSKVKYYARRGLPDGLRKRAWTVLTGVDRRMTERPGEYAELVERAEGEYDRLQDNSCADRDYAEGSRILNVLETVERDIHRTFPKHYLFHMDHPDDLADAARAADARAADVRAADAEEEELMVGFPNDDDDEVEELMVPFPPRRMAGTKSYMGMSAASVINEEYDSDDGDDFNASSTSVDNSLNISLDVSEKRRQFTMSIKESRRRLSDPDREQSAVTVPRANGEGEGLCSRKPARESGSTKTSSGRSLDLFGEESAQALPEDDDRTLATRRSTLSEQPGMGHGQAALRRVLFAYSLYDGEVGYCQGMNFVTAMFLTFLSEEESFWLLVVVMNEEPYKLRELFGEDMAGTHEMLYIAEKLMTQFLPKLSKHLEHEGIHISMFVTQWLLTVYTSIFPFDLVARVWDSFLVEGWKVVYRVMLALLEAAQPDLLQREFEGILGFLREYPSTVDGPAVMAGSLRINLKRKHIQKHVAEWRKSSGAKDRPGGVRRQSSDRGSSLSSGTLNSGSLLSQERLPKFTVPRFGGVSVSVKKTMPKEIVVEDLSHELLPVLGSKKFAVLLHNLLSPEECADLVDRAEERGFEDASIYDRRTNQARRNCTCRVSDDPALAENWFERLFHALRDHPALEYKLRSASFAGASACAGAQGGDSKLSHAVGLNERLRLMRYRQGEFFQSHRDARYVRGADRGASAGETSYVSVQVHLNHKFKGGATRFHGEGRHLDVRPRTGGVLVFEHDLLNSGQRVTSGKKYVLRSDVMYSTTCIGRGTISYNNATGTTVTERL